MVILQKKSHRLVVDVQWVNPDKLFKMFRLKQLHPLITYVEQLIG